MTADVFEVRVWRSYYDQVNILGQYLRDSRPDHDDNPPKFTITPEESKKAQSEISQLLSNSSDYLDRCKIYAKEPKWHYHTNNPTTWVSSEKFKFSHLAARSRYMKVILPSGQLTAV